MKLELIFISVITLCLCSCSKPGPSNPQPDTKAVTTQAGAAPNQEQAGTFWELLDKSDLTVVTDPWPPREGAATLKAEVSTDDDDEMFTGTVAYRVAATEEDSTAWQPMPKVREGADKSVYFESPVTLSKGTVYIEFRVRGAGESAYNKDHIDLTDWKVEVQ